MVSILQLVRWRWQREHAWYKIIKKLLLREKYKVIQSVSNHQLINLGSNQFHLTICFLNGTAGIRPSQPLAWTEFEG